MQQQVETSAETSDQRVRRATDFAGKRLSSEHQMQLTRVLDERLKSEAEDAGRRIELTEKAFAPLQRIVEEDKAATRALREANALRQQALERRASIDRPPIRTVRGGPSVGDLIPDLHAGINVFSPPYDFQRTEPVGPRVTTKANRSDGSFSFAIAWGEGGARFGTAGVGVALEATTAGVAHIRPAWRYDYGSSASGHILSSHSEGAGVLVVQDGMNGQILKESTASLWNFDNDHWEEQNGFIDSWALAADVLLQPGQIFTVWFLAKGMVADSGDKAFAFSLASGWVDMSVPFFVVELGSK
jgi:hypothetical protein